MPNSAIILVEDNEVILGIGSTIPRLSGYPPVEARVGRMAIEGVCRRPPEEIARDVSVPALGGREVRHREGDPRMAGVPTVARRGPAFAERPTGPHEGGCDGQLVTPAEPRLALAEGHRRLRRASP